MHLSIDIVECMMLYPKGNQCSGGSLYHDSNPTRQNKYQTIQVEKQQEQDKEQKPTSNRLKEWWWTTILPVAKKLMACTNRAVIQSSLLPLSQAKTLA
jgi:hypothetical protein